MTHKVYMGNLSYNVGEDEIRDLFSQDNLEVVDVKVIMDRDSGRSKGFGFVQFETKKDLEGALKYDGKDFQGRPLKVSIAKPQQPRNNNGGGHW